MLTKALLLCGLAGSSLFVIMFFIEGAYRADYDAIRYPVSSLSIGDTGWFQVTNFIVSGSFILVFALGLRRALLASHGSIGKPVLTGLMGLGLIGAGIFSTDPVYGYPPSLPLTLAQYTVHGHLHDLFSLFVFIGLPVDCFLFRHRFRTLGERGWAAYSLFTGIAMPLMFVLCALGFKQTPGFVDYAGVFQRLSIMLGCLWVALLSVYFLGRSRVGQR